MTQAIQIPDIGDAEEVQVIELCVEPGDSVRPDDVLIVIESDKASMEVPAGLSGIIEALTVAACTPSVKLTVMSGVVSP